MWAWLVSWLLSWLTWVVLSVQDWYIDLEQWQRRSYVDRQVANVVGIKPCSERLLCIFAGTDITPQIALWYQIDSIISCGSLSRWLYKLHLDATVVNIVYLRNGAVYSAVIDLDSETEMLTNTQLDFGSLELSKLPGKVRFVIDADTYRLNA